MLQLAIRLAKDYDGCTGVLVDAKAEAVAFYEKLGFVPLEGCLRPIRRSAGTNADVPVGRRFGQPLGVPPGR